MKAGEMAESAGQAAGDSPVSPCMRTALEAKVSSALRDSAIELE